MKSIITGLVLARTAVTGIITAVCFANLPPVQAQVRFPDPYPYVTSRPQHPGLYDEREREERRREERMIDELRHQRNLDAFSRYGDERQREREEFWRDYNRKESK